MLLKDLISKGCLRLALIDVDDLLNVVRSSILFSSNADICDKYILDAISNKRNETKIAFRGTLVRNANIATVDQGAAAIAGKTTDLLLTSNARYPATRNRGSQEGIVVDLARPFTINTIALKLQENDPKKTFSYYVEVSMDQKRWVVVADRTKYLCRSLQTLRFHPRLVRFIRFVGTACSASIQEFPLMGLEALFSTTPSNVNSEATLIVPSDNIATIVKEVPVVNGLNVVVPLTTCPHRSQTTGAADIRIDANAVCDICSEAAELWVCLTCYKVHCGRYVRGHALSHHFSEPTHAMSLSLANFSVWCYPCEAFVHNKVLIPAKPFARYA